MVVGNVKLRDLTSKEKREIKKNASGRACWCKPDRTCEPCLARAAKALIRVEDANFSALANAGLSMEEALEGAARAGKTLREIGNPARGRGPMIPED